jgi:hypothetical protein
MMDFVDFSVPSTVSGKFIELYQAGALQKTMPLWDKFSRLRKRLAVVEENRSKCNAPGWLLQFAKKCQQQDKDFEKELRLLVDGLEILKASIEQHCEKLYFQLEAIDRYLVHTAHTLVEARFSFGYTESRFARGKAGLEILKRDWVIETNPNLPSDKLCRRFDVENIPLPERWTKAFPELNSWSAAYRNPGCSNRIHKMFSEIIRQLRLP